MTRLPALLRLSFGCSILTLGSVALGQARPPAPATQPANVSPRAYSSDDTTITPQLARLLEAKRVTFKTQNTPVLKAVAELAKQTGYNIQPSWNGVFNNQRTGNVTVSLDNQPFWVVMRELCTRANIALESNGNNTRAVPIVPANYNGMSAMRVATSIQGPFLVAVSDIQRINVVNLAEPEKTSRNIQVQIQGFMEPKIVASQISYQPVIEEAVDDNGNSMKPENPPTGGMQGDRGVGFFGTFTLPYPSSNPGKKIAKVKGHIPAKIELSADPVEITDPLKSAGTEKTASSGQRVALESLKESGDGNYMAEIAFYRNVDKQDPQAFMHAYSSNVGLHLTDAQGREYPYHNAGGRTDGEKSVRMFAFRKPAGPDSAGAPVKLVIDVSTGTVDLKIPFELLNLPLP